MNDKKSNNMNERKNPYPSNSPEWMLWENAFSAELLVSGYLKDAARYQEQAEAARTRANLFYSKLEILNKALN